MSNLKEQIADARKSVRECKKTVPWIFPEYHELSIAREEYEAAKLRYEYAKKAWKELGQ